MPDIQTALSQALSQAAAQTINSWEEDDVTPKEKTQMTRQFFAVTTNVSRATFDFIQANPGKTAREVGAALQERGYNPSSVSSLINQMRRQGTVVQDSQKALRTAVAQYAPIKPRIIKQQREVFKAARKPRKSTPKKAVVEVSAPFVSVTELPAPPTPTTPSVASLLDTLSIKQARELYVELHKIFGGGK